MVAVRLPSIPGPSDVLAAVEGVRDGVGDAMALVPRVATAVGRMEDLLGRDPFVTFNSDTLWIEGPQPNLTRLLDAWDPERMDVLMLVAPSATSIGYDGLGDMAMDATGALRRLLSKRPTPEFDAWLDARGIWRGDGPGPKFGDVEAIR